jgi:hypothetical protein
VILCVGGRTVRAGGGSYPVSEIPASLVKDANMVIRLDETRFTLKNTGKANLYHHYVYTILNEKADKFAKAVEYYDKLRSIDYIDGNLFDATGKKITSLKKSDIKDISGTEDISLADDSRLKSHSFYCKVYPYTVEYEVSLDYSYTMFFPIWIPMDDDFVSIEHSRLQMVCPADYQFRYKSFNFKTEPAQQTEKGNKITTWEVNNMAAFEKEALSPPRQEITPTVYLGPVQFEVQSYAGTMDSWQNLGKFLYKLKENRDQLPQDVKQKVHQITDGIADPKEKIAKLYKFMQDNTRYISIQLGIGGWQPYDASYVASKRYGDCKALSNYMYSLLKEAGIPSNYTLINAGVGNTYFVNDFPCAYFNHAILSVPLKGDTVWLECTDQTLPAGYLSAFTSDRYALAINENGGVLVRTPNYGLKDNLEIRHTQAVADESGNLTIDVVTKFKGIQQDDLHDMINTLTKEKVMDVLKEEVDLPQYDLVKYNYREYPSRVPEITETLQLTAANYAQVSGKRLFIAPNILTKSHYKLIPAENRMYDVVTNTEYTDIDTAEIKLPGGYQPESIPEPVVLESRFGKYSANIKIEGDKLIYYRSMEKFRGRYPPAEYNNLVKFWAQVYKMDRNKVVLVKKGD